jgi:hypothetical protein
MLTFREAHGRTSRRGVALIVTAVAGLAVSAVIAPAAMARPVEQTSYHNVGSFVLDDLCEGMRINVEFDDSGHVLGRVTGRDRTLRYTVTGHVTSTWTNLETGRAMTFNVSHVDQDVRVSDNGDGTISILTHHVNNERAYGPDGSFEYVEPGVTEMLVILDYGGTLLDPSDDTFVDEMFVAHHGGKPGTERDFCEDFRTLTG